MDMTSADLDEVAEDEFDGDDEDEEDERAGHTRRRVRYVMPVMVEVDCDTDEITSVVTLPGEARLDRDDTMDLCVYDETFRRRPPRRPGPGARPVRLRAAMAVPGPHGRPPGELAG